MPEGYWCGGQDADDLPLPIAGDKELDQFGLEWKLMRKDEPGLSVVAPFIHPDLKAERLLQAVAVHFFTRILRGELIVEVFGEELGSVTLNESTIAAACKNIRWDGPKRTKRHVAPPIDFVRQCLQSAPWLATPVLGKQHLPHMDESSLDEKQIHELRSKYSAGELIGVRVNLWLPKRSGGGDDGHLDVWVQYSPDETRCDSYYVREGMTITKINSRSSLRGVNAAVFVDNGALATLLGDTEGPAHEDWDTSAERPDRVWKTWKGRVTFVRRIVDNLVELLTPPVTEPDFDLLSDFFSIERISGEQRQRKLGKDVKQVPKVQVIGGEPKWYHITQRTGGFTVSRNAPVPMPGDPSLRVSVAYDIPRGDPLRNWSPFDFDFGSDGGPLKFKGGGVDATKSYGNVVLLKVTREKFSFAAEGFDVHRDLFVRADEINGSSGGTE